MPAREAIVERPGQCQRQRGQDSDVTEPLEVRLDGPAHAGDGRDHAQVQDRVQLDEDREPLLADERRQDSVLFGTDGAGLSPPLENPRARRLMIASAARDRKRVMSVGVISGACPVTRLSRAIRPISFIRCIIHPPTKARVWVSGDGATLTDSTGREYIDGLSGCGM